MLNSGTQSWEKKKIEYKKVQNAALKIQIPISDQKGIIFIIIKPYAAHIHNLKFFLFTYLFIIRSFSSIFFSVFVSPSTKKCNDDFIWLFMRLSWQM